MDERSPVDVSIVVPAFNESENIPETVARIADAFAGRPEVWEIVVVDDGSTDNTRAVVEHLARDNPRVIPAGYPVNRGRGRALREGFAVARGAIIVTTDADLSYAPGYILDLVDALLTDPEVHFVLGSPYMPGGGTAGVPRTRLWVSQWGNRILRATVNSQIHTFTGIFRAYRREVLQAIELESDGKEIHLEILSRALGAGYRAQEVPAVLAARKKGRSKFRFGGTARSHLLFSFNERPILVFGLVGALLMLAGLIGGIYVSILRFQGTLNPGRPLTTLVVILMLAGLQILSAGYLALQIVGLRREIFKLQRESRLMRRGSLAGDASRTASER